MYKSLYVLLIAVFSSCAAFGQGNVQKAASSAAKRLGAKAGVSAQKTASKAVLAKWKQTSGLSFAAHPSMPRQTPAKPAYRLAPEKLFTGYDKEVIKYVQVFNPRRRLNRAKNTAEDFYLEERNSLFNTLQKVVWRNRLNFLEKHSEKLLDNLEIFLSADVSVPNPAEAAGGAFKYVDFIPRNTRVLYIGEEHYQPSIRREIISVLEQLRAAHPKRKIVLLSEFLPNTFFLDKGKKLPQEIKELYGGAIFNRATELGMSVGGLEDYDLVDLLDNPTFRRSYADLLDGVSRRNERWAVTLRELIKAHPKTLFVVYGGAGHMEASLQRSLPVLVNEKNSFILHFNLQSTFFSFNPLFSYIKMPRALAEEFENDLGAKLISYNKNKKYTKIFGFDLSVIVH